MEGGYEIIWVFPIAQMVKNLPAMQETRVQSLGQEDFLEEGMEDPLEEGTVTLLLPGESYGQRSLAGYSPYSPRESDVTEAT